MLLPIKHFATAIKGRTAKRVLYAVLIGLVSLVGIKWWLIDGEPNFGVPPDFQAFNDSDAMKAAFFDYLTPIIQYHNDITLEQREELVQFAQRLEAGKPLKRSQLRQLRILAEQYKLVTDAEQPQDTVKRLLLRVDIIPVELALIQAAKESGWGRSRFAVKANNLFGQWCYKQGCGIVPNSRPANKHYELRRFRSVSEAIRVYINNLNTHPTYKSLRLIRAGLRAAGQSVGGIALADGLLYYSQRRADYVDEIKTMIYQYRNFQESREKT